MIKLLGKIPQAAINPQADLAQTLAGEEQCGFAEIAESLVRRVPEKNPLILITSPAPSCGKTYAATHISLALAGLGHRVCLVDLDLRLPSIKNYLSLPRDQKGIENLESAQRFAFGPNIDVICANKFSADPEEFLRSKNLGEYLNCLRKLYDFVILDSPPLLAVDDAKILGQLSSATVLVLRSGEIKIEALKACKNAVTQSQNQPLFALLNGVAA